MVIEGLSVDKIKTISKLKQETEDVLDFRLKSYEAFKNMPLPSFGPSLDIDFDKIIYYASNDNKINSSWESIDKNITNEFDTLGVIESEKNLDGMGVQYESEVIYHNMIEELEQKHVIFTSIEDALKKYPALVKKYFSKIVKYDENKFVALNGSCFSGGSFIYIPIGRQIIH